MVNAVRSGESQRSVAKRFGVSMSVVHRWVKRAGDKPLDNVNWHDRPSGFIVWCGVKSISSNNGFDSIN